MCKNIIITVIILFGGRAGAIPPYELPFGSCDLDLFGSQSFGGQVDTLHDLLGFNVFWEYNHHSIADISVFGNAGISVIRGYSPSSDSLGVYSNYNYAKIEAEEYESRVRMYGGGDHCRGGEINDTCWVAAEGESEAILFGPDGFNPPCWGWPPGDNIKYYMKLERKYPLSALAEDQGQVINYNVDIRAMIDSLGPHDPVCTLKVACQPWNGVAHEDSIRRILTVSNFNTVDTWQVFNFDFTIPDSIIFDSSGVTDTIPMVINAGVKIKIVSSGERTLRVDWIKIYDTRGKDLVERNEYSDEIANFVPQYADLGDTLWGWYFRDEPYYVNIPVMGSILDTARVYGNNNWRGFTPVNNKDLYSYWFDNLSTDVIAPDIYPFFHIEGQDSATYTGYQSASGPSNPEYPYVSSFDTQSLKMQNRMNYFMDECQQAYFAASNNNGEFWIIPQCFKGGGVEDELAWRKPTKSELSCETFMALANGARGILYWKYGMSGPWQYGYISGIYDTSGTRTDLWDAIVYNINPYIKAIDSTYMALSLDTAYYFTPEISSDSTVPAGSWLDTIYAVSDTPNPDLGWFHIGQFTEGSDKYVMIVNRACSQGPEDPDPAPPVTATIKFGADNLDLGNYVYVIDIATGTDSADWEGTPDTTYTAVMPDGTIPFTTILGPGEGRLYKIVQSH